LRRYNKASITLDRIGTYGVSAQLGAVTLCLPYNATTLLTTVYTQQQASVCILPADVVAAAAVGPSRIRSKHPSTLLPTLVSFVWNAFRQMC
jgi:hypothetical protein